MATNADAAVSQMVAAGQQQQGEWQQQKREEDRKKGKQKFDSQGYLVPESDYGKERVLWGLKPIQDPTTTAAEIQTQNRAKNKASYSDFEQRLKNEQLQKTMDVQHNIAKRAEAMQAGGSSLLEKAISRNAVAGRPTTTLDQVLAQQAAAGRSSTQLDQAIQQQALGQGPSLAEAQMRQAQERTFAQQLAAAQAGRGGASMNRNLLRSQAEAGQAIAQQAGQARLQEMLQAQQLGLGAQGQAEQMQIAQQQLGLGAQGQAEQMQIAMRQQGLAAEQQATQRTLSAGQLAGQQQQVIAAQQAAQSQQLAQQQQFYEQLGFSAQQAALQAQRDWEKQKLQAATQIEVQALRPGPAEPEQDWMQPVATLGAAFAKSDRRAKKDIKDGKKDSQEFLDALKSYSYKYKNPNTPFTKAGKQNSVMAQDLEKSKAGRNMVSEMPDGSKVVDYGSGFATMLAAQATLNERLNDMEKAFNKGKK